MPFVSDFEKLGVFYLGKTLDTLTGEPSDNLLLYESKNLTTHAVCLGMTGSGKTGLGITILEEAGLDKIPAIIIDPKGDLSNLALTFPNLSQNEFLPWIDEAEAQRKGMTPTAYAETVATTWKDGLAKWGEDPERIKKFRDSVEITIYTPASNAGIPLSILSSFAAPSKELMLDAGALRDRVLSLTSSILGLLGISADPIKSREHILISTLIEQAWREEKDLDIATLIQQIQKPPFEKIGALDIDTFFPLKERIALSISLNSLLASPGFQAWMEGEPLDINQLLNTKEGKPKLSILSIAHLSESERMFFVTLLLNELLSWMRRQPGTSSLRALFYMDEIFGYFPPISTPPSKLPMMTLLKQARAFGLGIVLATQNPVDLDYKGLSNCGTWFIGKLQTERDKSRVCEGLAAASNGEIDANALNKMLSSSGNRRFIMRSIYEKNPIIFETRWTMSYLRGPLTLVQINSLTDKSHITTQTAKPIALKEKSSLKTSKPMIPPGIAEYFVQKTTSQGQIQYSPKILGIGKLHFVDSKLKIDLWQDINLLAPADNDGKTVLWDNGENVPELIQRMENAPLQGSTFSELPAGLMQEKNYATFEKSFAAFLYQNQTMNIYRHAALGLLSKKGESESDFRLRVILALREQRDEMAKKVRDKYADKITLLKNKLRNAQEKLNEKKQKRGWQIAEAFLTFGTTILGAIFGRGVTKGTITQAGTSLKRAGKVGQETQTVSQYEESCKAYQRQLDDLEAQLQMEINNSYAGDPSSINLETIVVRPRKSDISTEKIVLVWIA